jgi:hypothetical protein
MRFLAFLVTLVVGHSVASAGLVDVSADFSGSRSGDSQLVSDTGGWDLDTFKISWNIVEVAPIDGYMTFRYTYTLEGLYGEGSDLVKDLSHFTLNVSKGFDYVDIVDIDQSKGDVTEVFLRSEEEGGFTFTDGLKWDNLPSSDFPDGKWVFTLTTQRAPVWGSFYAKDGRDVFTHNKGLVLSNVTQDGFSQVGGFLKVNDDGINPVPSPTDATKSLFIAVPDSTILKQQSIVPEPISIASWIGLMGVGGLVARRRNRK